MRIVILLPWRSDGGWRDQLWTHCQKIWQQEFPDWPVFQGTPDDGPFNRSQGVNRASQLADAWYREPWDVALVIDGDTISDPGAVRRAVQHALDTGDLAIAHDQRIMLDKRGTEAVVRGHRPNLRSNVQRVWRDSVSCAVAVRRDTWNAVRGFDERFVGWGYEDTAFYIACETVTGRIAHKERADCIHLWHLPPPETTKLSPTLILNGNLKLRYQAVHWDREGLEAVLNGDYEAHAHSGPIPKILHRTLPTEMNEQVESWWTDFATLHPDWELRTWRDPLDPKDFPLTAHLHPYCANGAQKAGLVRLELLVTHGGVYVDSDVQPVRPLGPLMHLPAFAAWEDERVVPDAVMGAAPQHPAFRQMLARAMRLIELGNQDAWETGPGGTTEMLPGRDDVLLLPPGSFYPVHYKEKAKLGERNHLPWVFLEHKWHHSWAEKKTLPSPQGKSILIAEVPKIREDIVICIPWRDSGDGRRREAYKWCLAWWQRNGFKVVFGTGQSRAEMCNQAAQFAIGDGARAMVFADADTWAAPEQITAAVDRALASSSLVLPYEVYSRLDFGATSTGLRAPLSRVKPERYATMGKRTREHVSGLVVVPVELWRRVGGFDERFDRWGFEDQAFYLACWLLGDERPSRVAGVAVHWAHRTDPTKNAPLDESLIDLMQMYCRAAGWIPSHGRTGKLGASGRISLEDSQPNADSMRAVLSGDGGPLSLSDAVS